MNTKSPSNNERLRKLVEASLAPPLLGTGLRQREPVQAIRQPVTEANEQNLDRLTRALKAFARS